MKRGLILGLALGFLSTGLANAATSYDPLSGDWNGTITANLKDPTGGGNPTASETGTPVMIQLAKSGTGLTGSSTTNSPTGPSKENWKLINDKYMWTDNDMSVTATAISYKDIPEWVRTQAKITEKDTVFAFKYASCTIVKTKKPCEPGKDLPDGLDKTGIWLFKVQNDTMNSNVYYTYSTGGKRILEQSFKLSKK